MSYNNSQNNKLQDEQLDLIARTVVQNTEDIEWIKEKMAKKADIHNLNNTLDQILGLVKKKDQELTFMGERVKRIEDDVKKSDLLKN